MSKQRDSGQDKAAPIEQRWLDSAPLADTDARIADTDARIAALLADIPPPPPLPPERLAAIAALLPRRPLPTRLPARLGIRWALALSFLLGSVSAVFARKQVAQLWDQVTSSPTYGPSEPPARPRKPTRGVSAETPEAAIDAEEAAGEAIDQAEPPAEPADREPFAATDVSAETSTRGSPPQPGPKLIAKSETPPVRPEPRAKLIAKSETLPVHPEPRAKLIAKSETLPVHPEPRAKLIAKSETLPVRPRPPKAGEGRGEGPSTAGIPRHLAAPAPPPESPRPPADDPLTALTPPPQPPTPLPAPTTAAPAETADVLMPLPPRPPTVAPPGSALHEEAALLRSAIESLRVDRRPSDALTAVAEHRRRFPSGALATDAQLLRVEALIALGRRQEALVALDDYRLAGESPGGTLQVTRAELLADRNCPQALATFDDLLANSTSSPPTLQRALRGRAICHQRLGDHDSARRDWREYLQRYPSGRFASEARNLIGQ